MSEIIERGPDAISVNEDIDIDEEYENYDDAVPEITEVDLIAAMGVARKSLFIFLDDDPDAALNRLEDLKNKSVYYSLGYALFAGANAVMSFDKVELAQALDVMCNMAAIINRHRHRQTLTNNVITKLVIRPDYNTYTEEEVHAELCFAEIESLIGLLLFIQEGSLISYIKGGFKLRKAHQIYRECQEILEYRTWSNAQLKDEFECGVDLGLGIFNLALSAVPPRIIKILQLLGFTAERDYAMERLSSGAKKLHSLRGTLCSIAMLVYYTFAKYILGYPKANSETLEYYAELLNPLLKESPNGYATKFLSARLEHITGDFHKTATMLESAVQSNSSFDQGKHVFIFELSWVYAALKDWRQVVYYSNILCEESMWSKTIYYYMKGCALAMCKDRSEEDEEEMIRCMREVPKHFRRFFGKSLPVEKFCKRRVKRFFREDNWLPLPMYELMYTSNYFYLLKGNKELLEPIIVDVDRTLEYLQESERSESQWYWDNYYLAVFLKGLCLYYMGYPLSAEDYFMEIVINQKKIVKDVHVISFALMELGYINIDTGNHEQAVEFLSASRATSIFITEFRVHDGLENLRRKGYYYDPTCDRDDFN